ncbi:indolepyruvate ferredoxin oxidoreductase family protein [Ilumatobacter sp.]|uniref:indolepyruvate ferredoxin oxidoreductase family protein n=1 Tax=Ilumatobacter sp. TaxID=1967498 RepID=UPI003750EFFA
MALIDTYQLNDRYTADEGTAFLTGIQALARIPLDQLRADRRAGHRTAAFVSGYQGSPLGGLGAEVERASATAPDLPIVFEQGVNEELAATAVMGSQLAMSRSDALYDGVVGLWYGKAPGVDRAADALRHAVFAGTSMLGGAVAIVGDDPTAKSSTIPASSAGLAADMHMPLFYPGDPAEALDLGRHAIALSRATGLWSALKIVTDVADATGSVILDPERIQPVMTLHEGRPYERTPNGRLLAPHTLDIEREIVEVRYDLARRYASDNQLNEVTVNPADAWIGIAASGITYREIREALSRLGLRSDADIAAAGIRLLKMRMPIPFDPATVRNFARGLETLFVVEEKQPNLETLIKDALYAIPGCPQVIGKFDTAGDRLLPAWGSLDADIVTPVFRSQLTARLGERLAPAPTTRERVLIPVTAARTPYFCSGCPHNRSTEVPEGSVVGAGIGCHTMVLFMDDQRVGDVASLTVMGNEGAQFIGMAPFVGTDHFIQNLGDGTYFHSGQLAIQAAVAAGVNVTYKLLYNGTVAMTGGQDPQGQLGVGAVAQMLLSMGVTNVVITSDEPERHAKGSIPGEVEVWDRRRLLEAQENFAAVEGVTVIIHDQACAAEARRDRKRGLIETPNQRIVINQRICEGCGDCGEVSNCLSVEAVETPFGTKRSINQTTCNLDFSCLDGDCPSFMSISQRKLGRVRRWLRARSTTASPTSPRATHSTPQLDGDGLAAPTPVVPVDNFDMRITGIGGTGVVTVAQILGTAAMLDGFQVRGLDQIGLSQKAGPVVSDVRLSTAAPSPTNRVGEGQAHLLLALDQLVAASPKGLATCNPNSTVVVGSTSPTPTGQMVTDDSIELPDADTLAESISAVTSSVQHWVDAQAVCKGLFGSTAAANIFIVGMAIEAGCLPIAPECVERAIELNGVAVAANVQAFRWGRTQISRPDFVASTTNGEGLTTIVAVEIDPSSAARITALRTTGQEHEQLRRYASELSAWGGPGDVERWLDLLETVAAIESQLSNEAGQPLLEAVAAGLFKLTAYKDEYEVARLMTSPEALAEAREVAGTNGSVSWKLHPPMMRALGLERKISVGSWATPAVRGLARSKRLRGTIADPFRWAKVRRVERELADEYRTAVIRTLGQIHPENYAAAVALAELPDLVRGYEDIKLASVERYRSALNEALTALS